MGDSEWAGRRFIVTGGTGTFGNQIVRDLLARDARAVTVISRDEKKQWEMRQAIPDKRLRFALCDVRDRERLNEVFDDATWLDGVFHAAALKHVIGCEAHPIEAVKTNIIGTRNVIETAKDYGIGRFLAISTDKAVQPVNVMGMTKAIMERLVLASNTEHFIAGVVRYGNVLASRGSVVELFVTLLKDGVRELPITDPRMTRFLLTIADAVGFALDVYLAMSGNEIWVKRLPAVAIPMLALALGEVVAPGEEVGLDEIGAYPGEKIDELLVSPDEAPYAMLRGDNYVIRPGVPSEPGGETAARVGYGSRDALLADGAAIVDILRRGMPELFKE